MWCQIFLCLINLSFAVTTAQIGIKSGQPAAGSIFHMIQINQKEQEKAYVHEQFTRNFKELQLLGQGLLKDHETGKLNAKKLEKGAKSINRCARTLKPILALGDLGEEQNFDKEIGTSVEFDSSIRKLGTLIWDFAHNPALKNSKVFDTKHAARAQSDLLTIIELSKLLGDRAKTYPGSSVTTQK